MITASTFGGVHDFFTSGTWLVIRNLLIFFAVVFWLATAWWVYKDARRRIERRGLAVRAGKLVKVKRDLGEQHYAEHREKPFFDELVRFITSAPTWALVVEGEGAIATMRKTIGATNPADAEPGSIRGDLASSMPDNLVHGSDSPESAAREIALWFS